MVYYKKKNKYVTKLLFKDLVTILYKSNLGLVSNNINVAVFSNVKDDISQIDDNFSNVIIKEIDRCGQELFFYNPSIFSMITYAKNYSNKELVDMVDKYENLL